LAGSLVFLPEADDDYQKMATADAAWLLERVCCYLLLADRIVVHPAYLWQSNLTNNLFFRDLCGLLSGQNVAMLLGEWNTTEDYIKARMDRLNPRTLQQTVPEYLQYKRWGETLIDQARLVDHVFPAQGQVFVTGRDPKFRALLDRDLAPNIDPQSTRAQLSRHIRMHKLALDFETETTKLQEFVRSSRVVSVDTFSLRLAKAGFLELCYSQPFRKRLLNLYYHANLDERIRAPGLRVIGDPVVDAFDAEVFWAAFDRLFGNSARTGLLSADSPAAMTVVMRLAESQEWREFRVVYFTVLDELEQALWWNARLLGKTIEERYEYAPIVPYLVSPIRE